MLPAAHERQFECRTPSKLFYGVAIFSSAFLLFQVQPLIAKIILPWFGGGAAVWIVCLLFFQLVLLLGYFYAHMLSRRFRPRVQGRIHAVILAASLLALPILPKTPGSRRARCAGGPYSLAPWRHGRIALFSLVRHQPAVAGVVHANARGRCAVSFLCAVQRRIHAGIAELPDPDRAHVFQFASSGRLVRRIRGVALLCAAVGILSRSEAVASTQSDINAAARLADCK